MSKPKQTIGTEITQTQTLTPLQLKFVRLLEMTPPQVENEIEKNLIENPALEIIDSNSSQSRTEEGEIFSETAEDMRKADYRDEDEIPLSGQETSRGIGHTSPYSSNAHEDYETADTDISLSDYLNEQLSELKLSPEIMAIAEYIVGNIDRNGYLTRTLTQMYDDITISKGIDIPFEYFEKAYTIVRGLEPPGIGANDLRDCLLLQLKRLDQKKEDVALATTIIKDYFDLFANKHYNELRQALSIDEPTLKGAINRIKRLNPKPGAQIGSSVSEKASSTIIPEFIVDVEGDKITVNLTSQPPELAISPSFVLKAVANDAPQYKKREYLYIKKHNDEAAELIQLLEMRQSTLLKVISAIAELQRPFFLTEDQTKIRPMVLKDIARLTGLDLSVISRATSGKYLQTRSGVYPLKLFFSEAPVEEDESISIHAIQAALKNLIDNEDKQHPLSDDILRNLLQEQGIKIARRTVTKYREKLGFPVARLRKEV